METLIYIVCLYGFFGFANIAFSESSDWWWQKLAFWPKYFYNYVKGKFD